jgi:hypothetical protein
MDYHEAMGAKVDDILFAKLSKMNKAMLFEIIIIIVFKSIFLKKYIKIIFFIFLNLFLTSTH